jgi:hypothetical protein
MVEQIGVRPPDPACNRLQRDRAGTAFDQERARGLDCGITRFGRG